MLIGITGLSQFDRKVIADWIVLSDPRYVPKEYIDVEDMSKTHVIFLNIRLGHTAEFVRKRGVLIYATHTGLTLEYRGNIEWVPVSSIYGEESRIRELRAAIDRLGAIEL